MLRVCIGANDTRHVAATHMGDTAFFAIYDIGPDNESTFIEQRVNTAREMDHAGSQKMKLILGLLEDVEILVARQRSPNFVNIAKQTPYQPVVVKEEEILETLILLSENYDQLQELVERRKAGERFDTIPVFERHAE